MRRRPFRKMSNRIAAEGKRDLTLEKLPDVKSPVVTVPRSYALVVGHLAI